MDGTPLLDEQRAAHYRSLIVSASWIVTLGRFDFQFVVNSLSRFNLAPQEGHLKAMKYLFDYLKKYNKYRLILDPTYRDNTSFDDADAYDTLKWREF
jgi:hypothetical protein